MLVRFFLIVYDRKRRHIDALEEFGPSERAAALERRFEFERTLNGDGNIEVVVLGGANLDTIKRTHSRYFGIQPTTR